ncbi:SDR family oxidoreductase [Rhodospirillum rubrum]|uniref:Short-chain dehydrogenase/reductase SDR n=1 Tax=Rhodospirillum rubrum (strain ATCC 11170 / ATH 1.1.1 / DSM 467 / LMG 4362 / NCIMB 8255 / S1) TaxID=269796 RepID=Q2RT33_RHORT|nr:SDR family oxidoreductase [Rhodospirillum rubrum]ABC22712.1 Short-chain dehydrogenase/reductase SDR [Rhodospirillum rubrum ATCC 11170]AEO48431.1 short-chain dehydrogenase/reductase sDR [Rhodospirillum rubrum F11]MBK5954310.1 oxidoreductase [Rhodospirillum rubrum]QXG78704.1 SDR family oxidoreductase [Rhodospirillum rubrum]
MDHPRRACVTGAANGIGRAIALHLSRLGWSVAGLDRDGGGLAAMAAAAKAEGLAAPLLATVDVRDEAALAAALAQAAGPEETLHGLVCCAGRTTAHSGPPEDLALADWQKFIDINLTGPFLCAKHAIKALERGRGAIVMIASTRAHQSEPGTEAYAASKGGLLALTHALALSLSNRVRVNAISPGWIATSGVEDLRPEDHAQHPAGRVGLPGDIAAATAWLLSDDAGFMTGAELIVDGGMTRKMIYRD